GKKYGAMKNLTLRQSKFVKAAMRGRSYAQAARDAGYSESVANVAGRKIAAKPAVQAALKVAQEESNNVPFLSDEERELLADFNELPDWPATWVRNAI